MNLSRAVPAAIFELHVLWRALAHRGCPLSKAAFLLGAGYTFGPWDLIPDRLPVIGYLDQIGFLVSGLALARFLVPVDLDVAIAGQASGFADSRDLVCATRLGRLRAGLQSASLAHWLAWRRRLLRPARQAMPINALATWNRHPATSGATGLGGTVFRLLGYRMYWRMRSPFARRCSDMRSIVVIGGSARSGTTLLRTMLGRHSMIASLPEATVFLERVSSPAAIAERLGWDAGEIESWQQQSRSQVEFIERFAGAVRARSGKQVWAEKTPKNVMRFGFVRRRFPHARIVHVVRDGRDVVCSLRRKPFAKIDQAAADGTHAARRCAMQWRRAVRAGLRLRGDARYHELRYEDLVHDPVATLGRLMAFLGLPWEAAMLASAPTDGIDPYESRAADPIFDSSIGRWRRDLSKADRRATLLLIGPLLMELGYQAGLAWEEPVQEGGTGQ